MMALLGILVFAIIRLTATPRASSAGIRASRARTSAAPTSSLFMIFNVIWTMFLFRGCRRRHRQLRLRQRGVLRQRHRQAAAIEPLSEDTAHVLRGRRPAAAHRRDAGLPHRGAALQAPAHLRGAAQRAVRRRPVALGAAKPLIVARQAVHPRRHRRPRRGRRARRRPRSRTSPGRACSTSPPAPSAAAASASARPGTPRSRCRPSCSSWACATTRYAKAPYLAGRRRPQAAASAAGLPRSPAEAGRAARRRRPSGDCPAHPTGGARHRHRRAVVLHHLRRLRPAVPRRHRARRPHRRHAALPGAGRVELPGRAQRPVQGPGEQGQPVEHVAHGPDGLGQGPALRGHGASARTSSRLDDVEWLFWVGCAGAYEDRAKKTTRRSPSCSTPGGRHLRRARQRRDLHR